MRLIHRFFTGGRPLGLFLLLLSVSAPLAAQTGSGNIFVHFSHTGLGTDSYDKRDVTITAGITLFTDTAPRAGWYLASATGCGAATVSGNTFTTPPIFADCFLSVNFLPIPGPPQIVTPSAGPHGSISPNTPVTVTGNYTATFTVTADPGYFVWPAVGTCFSGIVLNAAETAGTLTTSAVVADCTVIALFKNTQYRLLPPPLLPPGTPVRLLYMAGANGSISGASPQTVNTGNNGSAVTAVPNTGYSFAQWSDGSTSNPRTDGAITNALSVTANFVINSYSLIYTAAANGSISGPSLQGVNSGNSGAAVTAVPNAGYAFVQWSDGSTSNPRTDSNVTANISVTANFGILVPTYTLTYTAGPNGTISGISSQTLNSGDSGSPVTAVPNAGYSFVQWSDGVTTNPRTDSNVMANLSVTASFIINTYTLSYTATANGSITGTSPQTVNYGANGSPVTAVPSTGYAFVQWSDGSTTNPRTDSTVMASLSVTASFVINTYTLTATAGPNGTITPLTQQVNYGTQATLTVTPSTGYQVLLDPSTTCPGGTLIGTAYTTAAIQANCLFAVTFVAQPAPVLVLAITDNRDYARFGMLLNYVITLSNTSAGDATGVTVSSTLSAQLDAANTTSICLGAGGGSICPVSGIGSNTTSGIVLPAGRTLVWLVSAPVLVQPIGTTVEYTVSAALSGALPISATDNDTLVVFRDNFDVPYADGTQAIPLLPLACAAELSLDGASRQRVVMPSIAAQTLIETLLAAHSDTAAGFRVERLSWHGSQGVRLVSVAADGSERASAWAMTQAGATLILATVQAIDGSRQLLLEGTSVSLQIALPLVIAEVLPLRAPTSSYASCQ